MHILERRNVNHAYAALPSILKMGYRADSRNGAVIRLSAPLITRYSLPFERVLFSVSRDANPFFHLFEALWMLAGRNDAAFVAQYVQRMKTYSDDGVTLNGAYGYRWRSHFGRDQLDDVIDHLRKNPNTRRAVLTMWDPRTDLPQLDTSLDVPCNLAVSFMPRMASLEMTVFCRSNDLIWGAYGANAVHLSMLQEYVASAAGFAIGPYVQISVDPHVYIDTPQTIDLLLDEGNETPASAHTVTDPYSIGTARWYPMFQSVSNTERTANEREVLDAAIIAFCDSPLQTTGFSFIDKVAVPLAQAHAAHKCGDRKMALELAKQCAAVDWRLAAVEWLIRRYRGQTT